MWYKQWKVRNRCLEKFALGNYRGQIFPTTTDDFQFFFLLFDKNSEEYEAQSGSRFNSARRYGPLRGLTSRSCGELWSSAEDFLALRAKKELLTLFVLILDNFWCSVVTSVVVCSYLSNFENDPKNLKKPTKKF